MKKNPNVDVERVMKTKYLHDFDRALQCWTWGYPTEAAYYRDAASTEPLLNVRIPLFCINAEDDPVAPPEALPLQEVKQNPCAVLCTTSMGGHLGWFEVGGGRWLSRPASSFLRKIAQECDLKALRIDVHARAIGPWHTAVSDFDPLRRKLRLQA